MADFVFNIARGRLRQYYDMAKTQPVIAAGPADMRSTANAGLVVVAIEAAGIEADATLRDYDDLLTLLAGTSNDQTTAGRKTIAGASLAASLPDDVNDRLDLTFPNQVYTALAGNAIGAVIVCYDNDTTAGTDSSLVPLTKHGWAITPDGSDVTLSVPANFYRSS